MDGEGLIRLSVWDGYMKTADVCASSCRPAWKDTLSWDYGIIWAVVSMCVKRNFSEQARDRNLFGANAESRIVWNAKALSRTWRDCSSHRGECENTG
jgi:hypothetical protein